MKKEKSLVKSAILADFLKILDEHCPDPESVNAFLHAMLESMSFLSDKRTLYRKDLHYDIRMIGERLAAIPADQFAGANKAHALSRFNDLSDNTTESIMLSAANAEGLILFENMQNEIETLIKE